MAQRSDAVSRHRVETQSLWLKLELLVSAVEDNLPLLEEALADADRPIQGCAQRIRDALEKINDG